MSPRPLLLSATLCAVSLWSAEPLVGAPPVAPIEVRRVVLFSSGVGYFEHAGTVDGNASTELRFKTAQINDILKSLMVEDSDGGFVASIAYPSQDPLTKTLKSFQVDLSGSPSLGLLLAQLRGARVAVTLGDQRLEGVILGVETQRKVVGQRGDAVDQVVVNLLVGAGIRAVPLDEVRGLDLLDPGLKAELDKALAAVAQARDQDQKPVLVSFTGQGQRRIRIGYVVEAPVWKTSYRLLLSGEAGQPSRLQGWAIVENQTENDWNQIDLTLVSGRPISFVQDLYQSQYVPRPVVQSEMYASLQPQLYEDGAMRDEIAGAGTFGESEAKAAALDGASRGMAPAPSMAPGFAGEAAAPMDPSRGVQSVANAEKLGEFFTYSVPTVSLPRRRSAMLPIVTDPITVERVSIYNRIVLAKHPLLGAKVVNSTGKLLMGGPVTVLDGASYGGDARFDDLPIGAERLISFAIDLQMQVQVEGQDTTSSLLTAKLVQGMLELQYRQRTSVDYLATNHADTRRDLIIEHQRQPGWTLADSPKPQEITEELYRFRDALAPGATSKLTVHEEHIEWTSYSILDWDDVTLISYQQQGGIPDAVKAALGRVAELKRAVIGIDRQLAQLDHEVQAITQEQSRIRENMRTVEKTTQYYQRLLDKLNQQETRLDQLRTERETLIQTRDVRQADLETFLADLTVE